MYKHIQKLTVVLFSVAAFSCQAVKQDDLEKEDYVEKVIDLQIQGKGNHVVELPEMYDGLLANIPDDSSESIRMVESLKKRGFKVVRWGRGNYPPLGPRIVSLILQKDSCFCNVNKMYYFTISETLYRSAENIRCGDSVSIFR